MEPIGPNTALAHNEGVLTWHLWCMWRTWYTPPMPHTAPAGRWGSPPGFHTGWRCRCCSAWAKAEKAVRYAIVLSNIVTTSFCYLLFGAAVLMDLLQLVIARTCHWLEGFVGNNSAPSVTLWQTPARAPKCPGQPANATKKCRTGIKLIKYKKWN